MNRDYTNLRLHLGDVYKALDLAYDEARKLDLDHSFLRGMNNAGRPVDYLIDTIDALEGRTIE